jgi:hypothetical protein
LIDYNFECLWDSKKKERISDLLSERVSLLIGNRIFQKIECLSFCKKEDIPSRATNVYVLSNERCAIINTAKTTDAKVYRLILDKEVLFSMLKPGEGQAYFDNLILEMKEAIS